MQDGKSSLATESVQAARVGAERGVPVALLSSLQQIRCTVDSARFDLAQDLCSCGLVITQPSWEQGSHDPCSHRSCTAQKKSLRGNFDSKLSSARSRHSSLHRVTLQSRYGIRSPEAPEVPETWFQKYRRTSQIPAEYRNHRTVSPRLRHWREVRP